MRRTYRKKNLRRRSRRPKAKVTKKLKRYVQRAIKSHIESKVFIVSSLNNAITTANGTVPLASYLLPSPSLGTASNNRIGNEIKLRKSYIRGYVNCLPYSAISNPTPFPIYVKMWLCAYKTIMTASISATNIATDFFNTGASNQGFVGNILDLTNPNNTDAWTIYATKTIKLSETVGTNGYADTGSFTRPFYFRIDKHVKSKLKFNDIGQTPTNKNLFLIYQAVTADGSATTQSAEVHVTTHFTFEDA